MKALIFIVLLIGMFIFSVYTFFGIITLIGLIAMIETTPSVKWIAMRTSGLLDIIIFVFTIIATAQFGVTIAASLTIAGLGYTAYYKPYLKLEYEKERRTRRKRHLRF